MFDFLGQRDKRNSSSNLNNVRCINLYFFEDKQRVNSRIKIWYFTVFSRRINFLCWWVFRGSFLSVGRGSFSYSFTAVFFPRRFSWLVVITLCAILTFIWCSIFYRLQLKINLWSHAKTMKITPVTLMSSMLIESKWHLQTLYLRLNKSWAVKS